ncbi:hypothetical protein Sango_2759200, partial [Sesamum angolense]
AFGRDWIDCLLMIFGWIDGRTCIIHAHTSYIGSLTLVLKGDCHNMQVSLFRFDNYLALSPGFLASVHSIWRHPIVGTPLYSVTRKLKALKPVFRQQRRCKGDLAVNVKLAAGFLERAKLQWLKAGDQCSRIFFRRVATGRANKRVFQISDDDGNEQIDSTDDEARAIIRPVTTDEVKIAFFDIEEDKAPGPDGFSSGFFKAAWPVVGKRIQAYILLQRYYKVITKILVSRIRVSLDLLISPSQNAFVPGRLISDNVLLAQELFSGNLIEQDGEFRYHWRCQDLKLFQLSFADDILLLCKADVRSAASGLRDSLLATLGFQEGLLPLRYLGLPLISAQLSITDCQPLLQKIDSRIKGWEGVQISFAGRVQLIKSVLISFEVYWAMAFILPKGIIKEMIKRLRTFLWKGTSAYGYPKVAWEAVCKPIGKDRTSIWVDWIIQVRLRDCSIWTTKENKGAWGWRKMLSLINSLMSHIHYCVGSGDSVSLWHDPWHPLGPLISRFPRGPQMTRTGLDFLRSFQWLLRMGSGIGL